MASENIKIMWAQRFWCLVQNVFSNSVISSNLILLAVYLVCVPTVGG